MTVKTLTSAIALSVFVSGAAFAGTYDKDDADMTSTDAIQAEDVTEIADADTMNSGSEMESANSPWAGMTVAEFVGMNVMTDQGEDVGEIDYVIVQDGAPAGVIGVGGFLGLGEYTVALPLDGFTMGEDGLIVTQTAETLQAMPEVDESTIQPVADDVMLVSIMENAEDFANPEALQIADGDVTPALQTGEIAGDESEMADADTAAPAMDVTDDTESTDMASGDMATGEMATDDSDMADATPSPRAANREDSIEEPQIAEGDATPMAPMGDSDTAENDVAEMENSDNPTMPTYAESTTAEVAPVEDAPMSIQEMTVGQIIGKSVIGPQDEVVGEIDYVIDNAGVIEAVIGIGGFLGLGEYTVAIPLENFDVAQDDMLSVGKTREELEALPEINETGLESLEDDVMISDRI
ncbi:PRC-barrel domain-containing protein [Pseudaestuariivita sp.]|uniref:PRC-barrel domain-containing protein n=1 Tax=Pseudaestuariivita sp. TaxID=2211669 RepID=UPI004058722E